MIAWNNVDFPTLARPTCWRLVSAYPLEGHTNRRGIVHTIPLFRLLPGRPRRIFFSSTCFFGGIFLLLAKVRRWSIFLLAEKRRGANTKAGPAADRSKAGGLEMKKAGRHNDGVVKPVREAVSLPST